LPNFFFPLLLWRLWRSRVMNSRLYNVFRCQNSYQLVARKLAELLRVFWDFHGRDISSRGLLGCDSCNVVIGYQRFRDSCCFHLLSSSHFHPEDGGSLGLRNVGILPQHYVMSQSSKPRPEVAELISAYTSDVRRKLQSHSVIVPRELGSFCLVKRLPWCIELYSPFKESNKVVRSSDTFSCNSV
jgi:hypothetical protein